MSGAVGMKRCPTCRGGKHPRWRYQFRIDNRWTSPAWRPNADDPIEFCDDEHHKTLKSNR